MRIILTHTSSSCESGHTKTAEDFDPNKMEDNTDDLAFFGFKEPSLRTSKEETSISPIH